MQIFTSEKDALFLALVQCHDCSLLPIGSTWDWKSKRSHSIDMGACSFGAATEDWKVTTGQANILTVLSDLFSTSKSNVL